MAHALIINDDLAASCWIKDELIALGFDSFDHVWTERDALDAAASRTPDVVVIGDALEEGVPFEAARKVAARFRDVIVLFMTAKKSAAVATLPEDARLDGPFGVDALPQALGRPGHVGELRAI